MFYKLLENELTFGPTVIFPNGVLLHPNHLDEVEMPYDGWYYFDSEEEAKKFFGIE